MGTIPQVRSVGSIYEAEGCACSYHTTDGQGSKAVERVLGMDWLHSAQWLCPAQAGKQNRRHAPHGQRASHRVRSSIWRNPAGALRVSSLRQPQMRKPGPSFPRYAPGQHGRHAFEASSNCSSRRGEGCSGEIDGGAGSGDARCLRARRANSAQPCPGLWANAVACERGHSGQKVVARGVSFGHV